MRKKIRKGCVTPASLEAQTFSRVPSVHGERNQKGPKCGQHTTTFPGVPGAQHSEENQNWRPHSSRLGGPKCGQNASTNPEFSGVPRVGEKIGSGLNAGKMAA